MYYSQFYNSLQLFSVHVQWITVGNNETGCAAIRTPSNWNGVSVSLIS